MIWLREDPFSLIVNTFCYSIPHSSPCSNPLIRHTGCLLTKNHCNYLFHIHIFKTISLILLCTYYAFELRITYLLTLYLYHVILYIFIQLIIMFRLCVASVLVKEKVETLYVPPYPLGESGSTVLERIVYCIVSVLLLVNWRTPSQ